MAGSSKDPEKRARRRPPARTPEVRESEMIALAVDVAEKKLRDGTASAPIITHYLKLATSRNRLEEAKLANENKLLEARSKDLESKANQEELYKKALEAMSAYSGQSTEEYNED